MTADTLVSKAIDIAQNYKTLYVMGCFGAPMTAANKKRWIEREHYNYNNKTDRAAMINAATADTFGFDCVNLIKGILWGWSGDASKTYGGAVYASNGVPDVSADGMIAKCYGVSTTGWSNMVPGEVVWMSGHIGVYIGNGLAVECSPKWENKVQITAVGNIGSKSGYNARAWTKHGKLPYVDYSTKSDLEVSVDKLVAAGVINSPEVWKRGKDFGDANVSWLIRKASALCQDNELSDACYKLFYNGVIDSPDYWAKGQGYDDDTVVLLIQKLATLC